MDPLRALPPVSLAVRRMAHPMGQPWAWIQFADGSVYKVEPFLDDDWIELSRRQVAPGSYFNQVVRTRPGYLGHRLPAWPAMVGEYAWQVLYYFQAP